MIDIDRPGIQQVNPIREWSTPLIVSVGNPDLVPQFTNSFEMNYTRQIKGGNIALGTFYRKIRGCHFKNYKSRPCQSNRRTGIKFYQF